MTRNGRTTPLPNELTTPPACRSQTSRGRRGSKRPRTALMFRIFVTLRAARLRLERRQRPHEYELQLVKFDENLQEAVVGHQRQGIPFVLEYTEHSGQTSRRLDVRLPEQRHDVSSLADWALSPR